MPKRAFYRDRYSSEKVWEVVTLSGCHYYLRQYIKGTQFGRGLRCTKQYIKQIGILDFEQIK